MNWTRLTEPFLDWLARFSAMTPDERQRWCRLVDASLKDKRHSLDESQIAAISKVVSGNPEFQLLSRIETNRMLVAIPLVASVPLGVVWGVLAGMLQVAPHRLAGDLNHFVVHRHLYSGHSGSFFHHHSLSRPARRKATRAVAVAINPAPRTTADFPYRQELRAMEVVSIRQK